MPKLKYAYRPKNKNKAAKAIGRELQISTKHSVEICREIRGMMLEDAKRYLKEVMEKKRPVPFKRYNKKVAHRKGLQGWPSGRYPVKAAREILKVLENAEANAEYKGLDTERLKITHISAHKARPIRGWIPRAFGRSTPFNTSRTHIQVILEEI
ncbi:LSU ribosomal protein L22P [Methanothermus fervidus DSM 2088]|uniref:Large ribosomal subunit protein uL22 n=1 Tax=Methanothermus fervidus (strain ATCC 43054 / DSM 2088 / JCM 10308 / V24 S) TaxID=523846 RepID=E3GZC3_METFV|nr:50S ribosomal protein L22 [Methanothermus fervidus]ADP77655.1 LSU ribosomal protein L22P [Methanothermus fervidus DSM 2088]